MRQFKWTRALCCSVVLLGLTGLVSAGSVTVTNNSTKDIDSISVSTPTGTPTYYFNPRPLKIGSQQKLTSIPLKFTLETVKKGNINVSYGIIKINNFTCKEQPSAQNSVDMVYILTDQGC